jgi:chromosomal replication initiation ATPase DnaA
MCTREYQSEMTGIAEDELFGESRKMEVRIKRNLCIECLRKSGMTLNQIGQVFNRDHATVINSLVIIDALRSTNDEKFKQIESDHKCFSVKD